MWKECFRVLKPGGYLTRLVTPKGGVVLDPFCGSGTMGIAALLEGFSYIGIEIDDYYYSISRERLRNCAALVLAASCK
jgi:DNA modification methylase